MEAINRLTTQFVDLEDRIQVTGATAMGRAVTLWLPQRLLNRVVPALCKRLDPTEGKDVRAEVKNSFAQQVAVQSLAPQPVVKSQPGAGVFTIRSISIKTEPKVTQIIFDLISEDVQVKHVPDDMHPGTVHEHRRENGQPDRRRANVLRNRDRSIVKED